MRITKRRLRRIIREAVSDTTHAVQRNYTDASGKRQFVPAGRSQAQRARDRAAAHSKVGIPSGNLSSANWNDSVNNPQTAADWKDWSKTFNLDVEHDNDGQIILYVDDDTPDAAAVTKAADRAGAEVQDGDQGRTAVIYTGAYDEGY